MLKNGTFGAEFREPGRIGHAVVVDGLGDDGNIRIRDPWRGTRYEMTHGISWMHGKDNAQFSGLIKATLKIRPISLTFTGTDDQNRYVYKVRFESDSKEVVEHTFTVQSSPVTHVEWESDFWKTTFEDADAADALYASILKFNPARMS